MYGGELAIFGNPSVSFCKKSRIINKKMDWNNFKFIDLFAGIGGIRLGFEAVGGKCVFSSEFDKNACKTYEANFNEHPSGDITKIEDK